MPDEVLAQAGPRVAGEQHDHISERAPQVAERAGQQPGGKSLGRRAAKGLHEG
jgi:hypothetical protein